MATLGPRAVDLTNALLLLLWRENCSASLDVGLYLFLLDYTAIFVLLKCPVLIRNPWFSSWAERKVKDSAPYTGLGARFSKNSKDILPGEHIWLDVLRVNLSLEDLHCSHSVYNCMLSVGILTPPARVRFLDGLYEVGWMEAATLRRMCTFPSLPISVSRKSAWENSGLIRICAEYPYDTDLTFLQPHNRSSNHSQIPLDLPGNGNYPCYQGAMEPSQGWGLALCMKGRSVLYLIQTFPGLFPWSTKKEL